MEFNYDLLEETRKQIKGMVFFRDDVEINDEEFEVIHDFEQAIDNAFHRYDYKYNLNDNVEYKDGKYGKTWVDILESNMAKVRGVVYKHKNYAELDSIIDHLKIPELEDIEYIMDDDEVPYEIEAEIELCAKSRFVCGKENTFFESLFKAYCLGGWPCGWNNGKIIVYVPEKE